MPEKSTGKAIQPFDHTLRQINGGAIVRELTDELTEVIDSIRRTGKSGSLTLTLNFKPRGSANEQIEVIPTIKGKKPEISRPISIFFVNNDNGLQRDDPTQHSIPGLGSVETFDKETGEVLAK